MLSYRRTTIEQGIEQLKAIDKYVPVAPGK